MMQVEDDNLKCPECGHVYPIKEVPDSKSE
jgi:uncharacterized protein YbaR (Trm112 family)